MEHSIKLILQIEHWLTMWDKWLVIFSGVIVAKFRKVCLQNQVLNCHFILLMEAICTQCSQTGKFTNKIVLDLYKYVCLYNAK